MDVVDAEATPEIKKGKPNLLSNYFSTDRPVPDSTRL